MLMIIDQDQDDPDDDHDVHNNHDHDDNFADDDCARFDNDNSYLDV